MTIKIYHECEEWIEKSIQRITDWHNKALIWVQCKTVETLICSLFEVYFCSTVCQKIVLETSHFTNYTLYHKLQLQLWSRKDVKQLLFSNSAYCRLHSLIQCKLCCDLCFYCLRSFLKFKTDKSCTDPYGVGAVSPWKISKLPNQYSILGHQQHLNGPLFVAFGLWLWFLSSSSTMLSYHQLKNKTRKDVFRV